MTQHSPDPAERLDESELRRLKTTLNAMLGSEAYVIDSQAQPLKGARSAFMVNHRFAPLVLSGRLCFAPQAVRRILCGAGGRPRNPLCGLTLL